MPEAPRPAYVPGGLSARARSQLGLERIELDGNRRRLVRGRRRSVCVLRPPVTGAFLTLYFAPARRPRESARFRSQTMSLLLDDGSVERCPADAGTPRRLRPGRRYPAFVPSLIEMRRRLPLLVFVVLLIPFVLMLGFVCLCISDHPSQAAERAIGAIAYAPALIRR